MTRLFLLAHQDDEIGVLQSIRDLRARGDKAVCVFLTDGAFAGVSPERRNEESRRVLSALGVDGADIHFLGQQLGIGDGRLVENLDAALAGARGIAARYPDVDGIGVHAWEGGHHDHDAAHLAGRALAKQLGVTAASRQFSLYRAGGADGRGLRFAAPDPVEAVVEETRLGFGQGIRNLALLRHYRSQLRVMAQLGPRAARRWLIDRVELLQHFPPAKRLAGRPAEHLLYERWKLYRYERFRGHADRFIAQHHLLEPSVQRRASRAPELVAL